MDDQNTSTPVATDEPGSSAQAPAPQVSATPSITPSAPKKGHKLLYAVLLLAILAASTAAYMAWSYSKVKTENASLKSDLATSQATTHELPASAIKLSECIPNMGSHYLPEGADQIYGPFLLVDKAGKVIGVEYMASTDMYTPIPGVVPPVQVMTKDSPMYGWTYDHSEMSRAPEGHEGFLKDHVDVHLYTVSAETQKHACGDAHGAATH